MSAIFYQAVVNLVLLFGAETLVLLAEMKKNTRESPRGLLLAGVG